MTEQRKIKSLKRIAPPLPRLIYCHFSSAITLADCAPDPAASDGTVTCSVPDADAFVSAEDNITIEVDTAASVNGGPGMALGHCEAALS